MKTIADFAIIGSLILTLWATGGLSKIKQQMNPPAAPAAAEKLGANHNEILVKDTGPIKPEIPMSLSDELRLDDPHPVAQHDCVWLECGRENAASLTLDSQKVRETKSRTSWLTSLWDFFFKGTNPPGGCDDWGCGMNHNEKLMRRQ
jgi:hypothetical protein